VLLFAGLDTTLDPVEREQMQNHEQSCASCRRLAAVVSGSFEPAAGERGDEIATAVLARTSGKACEQVAELLADSFDVRADAAGSADELLDLHLATCPDCATLARTLAQLRRKLPALAEADPGSRFVGAVLAATLGSEATSRSSVPRRARSHTVLRFDLAGLWDQLARRPRLALEGSWVVTMLALLIFGMPSWSASESTVESFEDWWRDRADVARELIKDAGDTAWDGLRSLGNENGSGNVEPGNTDSAN
jgi:hypothetical protein